ncbi:MAG: OsmC family protein [Fidelibacterota bacterium]
MPDDGTFSATLTQLKDYQFRTTFEGTDVDPIILDEPPPLGSSRGPSASRLLAASVGHCLSASLLFCLRKARVEVVHVRTNVQGTFQRNEKRRLRVGRLDAEITLNLGETAPKRMNRCLGIFEDFCVVTGAVRKGVKVTVKVTDHTGTVLHQGDG